MVRAVRRKPVQVWLVSAVPAKHGSHNSETAALNRALSVGKIARVEASLRGQMRAGANEEHGDQRRNQGAVRGANQTFAVPASPLLRKSTATGPAVPRLPAG